VDTVHVLAANMNRLMGWLEKNKPHLASNEKLAKAAGVSSSTIGQMRRADGAVQIDKLSKVAKAVGLTAAQMLTPGMHPEDPPELVSDQSEKAILRVFRSKETPEQPARRH